MAFLFSFFLSFLLSILFIGKKKHLRTMLQKEAIMHNATKRSTYAQCTDKQKNKVIFLVQQKKTQ